MCPKGKSFGGAILEGQEDLFEISGTVYSANYVKTSDRGTDNVGNYCKSPACNYLLDLNENVEDFDNYYGGSVSCYDSSYKFVADFNIFHTALDSTTETNENLKTKLYGIQVSGEESKLESISYCKITGFRKDISMFAFFDFDLKDNFTDGVKVAGGLVDILIGLYSFPGKQSSSNAPLQVNMTCLNPTENDNNKRDKTVDRIYPVTATVMDTGSAILIKGNDQEDPTHTPIGRCSFLYSKQFGNIPLMNADISAIIGQDGVAGSIENGIVLWGGQNSTKPTPDRRLLFTDDDDERTDDDSTATEEEEEEEEILGVVEDNVKPGETTIIDEYVPPVLKIFTKLDSEAKIVTPSPQEVQQTVIKGAKVEVMQFSECTTNKETRIKTCAGPMLKASATVTSVDTENNNFKYTPELLFTDTGNDSEDRRRRLDYATTAAPKSSSTKDYAFLVNSAGAHPEIECSGKGTCDRTTGVCKCELGYQGSACQRKTCPNNCNGRGRCLPLNDVVSSVNNGDIYGNEIIYGCKCDGGYRGSDCSLIECPSANDPLSATNIDANSEYRDCSGRGKCDYTTGVCTCFGGYSGDACDQVRSTF